MIDAPVTGGVMGARIGKLNFLVGGSDEAVALAKPLFDIMGQKILHAGEQGSGVGVKICNNMSLGISMIASAEALMLAKRLKMDVKKVHSIIKEASGNKDRSMELMKLCSENIQIFTGDDKTSMSDIIDGFSGNISVTANGAPLEMHMMCKYSIEGKKEKAGEINSKIEKLIF